jgi:hypothetical protein
LSFSIFCFSSKLSQSAHINHEILSGPYSGLSQHESAVEVTTVVQEQFNTLESKKETRSFPTNALPGVNEELRRRSLDTVGVMDAVYDGWKRFSRTEESYREIIDSSSLVQRRSDLTDSKSMKLYCSFFDKSTPVTNLEMNYMSGGKVKLDETVPKNNLDKYDGKLKKSRRQVFQTAKAKMMGLSPDKSRSPALFPREKDMKLSCGYEQINDDLFARKDNRFVVFNGAGVESSWPPKPKSKIASDSLVADITITVNVEKR